MQPFRVRFSIESFSKEEVFYFIDLSEYNVDDVKSVLIDGRLIGFYYDSNKKELGIPHIDLITDKSVYIDFYSVLENRNHQLKKLGI